MENMNNGIYSKKGVLSKELCDLFIKNFKKSPDTHRSDFTDKTNLHFNVDYLKHPEWEPILRQLVDHIYINLNDYLTNTITAIDHEKKIARNILDPKFPLTISPSFNMQYYKPGEAFHQWHAERMQPAKMNRVLVWMFYLNDVTDQGGTEFYHQKHIETAEQGKMVLFSSDWLHTHRGIPSPTQEKYILTGWLGWYDHRKKS